MTRHESLNMLMISVVAFAATNISLHAQGTKGYYRFPAIHQDTIAFVAEGDIWTVGRQGGQARRLTSHPSEETHPQISPDGRTIAFAARYEGPTETYTMPLAGGAPIRRTFEAEPSIPVGWTPGGKLIYNTWHYSTLPDEQLCILDLSSGGVQRVPLSQASDGAMKGDGTIFFARPRFHRQNAKRYQGGTARNIWKFVDGADEAVKLTTFTPRECHSPMIWSDRVYFATDRDGTMNIWSMNEEGGDLRQHTKHSGLDVQSPSLGHGRIVYQLGADLWLLDIETGIHQTVPITLVSDLDQLREKWIAKPAQHLTSVHVHPAGESVVLTSRGRVFVAPVKHGRLVRVSRKKGVRYRAATFMPDGEQLLTLSDETDELEFWTLPARGIGEPRQITSDATILRWGGVPSPNGKYIASADKNYDLWIINIETGERQKISHGRDGIRGAHWSPDSRWLVFSEAAVNTFYQLHLYDTQQSTTTVLTSDRVNSFAPAWSSDGNWLYFVSDRNLVSIVSGPWGPRQPEPYFDKPTKLFRLALRKGVRSPFQPGDELENGEEDNDKDKDKDKEKTDADGKGAAQESSGSKNEDEQNGDQPEPIVIEVAGIQQRVKEIPAPAAVHRNLAANEKALFWQEIAGGPNGTSSVMALEFGNDKEPQRVASDISSFELSADGKKLMIQKKGGDIFVVDAAPKSADLEAKNKVDLSAWSYSIDVREDWRQIFVDAWRLHRDYFYDPNMHGVNWKAVREKYAPMVERVTTRAELSDVIGQMVGELSALHTAVRGGDHREGPDDVVLPTLGARLQRDENAGGYRIDYIYKSDPDYPKELSPLADPDIDVVEGDIIESINGESVLAYPDPHLLLRNQQGRQVLIRIRSPRDKDSREVIVTPTSNEFSLRLRDWQYSRRLRVEEAGKGKIGYVHLSAMGGRNITEWYRNFYPVFRRQGLIIDVRHNRGGNIDSLILEKLLRRAWFYWKDRVSTPYWNMQYAFRGHLVVLCDEHTASDGEAFTEGFRRLGLGKVIGTRTWGGEIWLSSSNRLSDGGIATAGEAGVYGPERTWLIEGHGVDPDIVVDNLPHATFKGEDAQLSAAIAHLLKTIEEDPREMPKPPPYPDKSFRYP